MIQRRGVVWGNVMGGQVGPVFVQNQPPLFLGLEPVIAEHQARREPEGRRAAHPLRQCEVVDREGHRNIRAQPCRAQLQPALIAARRRLGGDKDPNPEGVCELRLQVQRTRNGQERVGPKAGCRASVGGLGDVQAFHLENLHLPLRDHGVVRTR